MDKVTGQCPQTTTFSVDNSRETYVLRLANAASLHESGERRTAPCKSDQQQQQEQRSRLFVELKVNTQSLTINVNAFSFQEDKRLRAHFRKGCL